MSGPNLTPGDPLGGGGGGGARPASAPPVDAPRPTTGYTSERPPGAGGDRLGPAAPAPHLAPALGPELVLESWGRRAGAQVIDGIIITLLALAVIIPFGIGIAGAGGSGSDGGVVALIGALIVTLLVVALAALIYAPLMLTKTNGRTVGRMATGIRVVRTNGQAMDFSTAMLREVVFKFVLINAIAGGFTLGLAALLDVLWPLWDEENRALHDFPVNTRTVLS